MAPVRCRGPEGCAAGSSAGGRREANVHLLVQADAGAGAGASVWAATYEGAPQPAATVTLHPARRVKGACPSFPHVAPRDGPVQRRGPKGNKKPWEILIVLAKGTGQPN